MKEPVFVLALLFLLTNQTVSGPGSSEALDGGDGRQRGRREGHPDSDSSRAGDHRPGEADPGAPWLGAQVCVYVCVFSFFPSSLEASVFFSAEWANYDFGFHFTMVLSVRVTILTALVFLGIQFLLLFSLKHLTRTSPQARPFLMVGGGDTWHWKAFRDTRFL